MSYDPLAEQRVRRGVANGHAGLDANGKVPLAQLPVMTGAGATHSPGYTPDPGTIDATTRCLSEDPGNRYPDKLSPWQPLYYDANNTNTTYIGPSDVIPVATGLYYRVTFYLVITQAASASSSLRVRFSHWGSLGDYINADWIVDTSTVGNYIGRTFGIRPGNNYANFRIDYVSGSGTYLYRCRMKIELMG